MINMTQTTKLSRKIKTNLLGYALVLPMILGFIIFTFLPLISTILGSMYVMDEYEWVRYPDCFVGFENFAKLFADPNFIKAIGNTVFLMIGIPIGMIIAFILATVLNSKYIKHKRPFLIIYYLPAVSSAIAIGIVWKWLFNAEYGLINNIFNLDIAWLSSPDVIKTTLIIKGVWGGFGGTLLLYFATMQNVPLELYEAADIEGANAIQKTFKITIPLVNGTTFYILVTGVIGGLMAFADNYVVASGSSANTIIYYLYERMKNGEYGLVAAGSLIVFVTLVIVTLIQFWINGKRNGGR